ncbi:LLM class flavin-dependent oxidoreductase [Oceanobacillus piezotolerans]|uniref:LLM class flavin-dependent oxidoreductase n=1 Tax=Oceanobacillus piezotolerans TaxID=2448030 RepID=A0A498DAF7_9BACI|nr:LLM class flavin-dependent oxidoreductase [Oceanobacillus piezotolerans]RLL46558.1 LLM class flavin-dependent oxidoreductase [Oceanobacillus piezotolerans]
MKLSILDQAPISKGKTAKEALEATIDLASNADKWGYNRYWIAEHHDLDGLASPVPDILLGIIGQKTEKIRLGSGAVLLPNYQPYHIAEKYNLLATLYPGRIDLGIGRAPGGSAEVSIALAGNFLEKVRKYPELIDELVHFLHGDFPDDHLFTKITPSPLPEISPEPWLLGTSGKSAVLAAQKALPFVFGQFMSDQNGPEIVDEYRRNFIGRHPKVFVTVSVVCAETTEEAEEIALSGQLSAVLQAKGVGKNGVPSIQDVKEYTFSEEDKEIIEKVRKRQIVGNPQEVKLKLETIANEYGIDEIMVVTITHSYQARKTSYELLANQFLV